jgi:DNA mismatch repair protein MutL
MPEDWGVIAHGRLEIGPSALTACSSRWRCLPYNTSVQRRPIHQLSPSLVNRIAAGEVIERPASVVKELVENALDAGATHITIEAQDGGRELVRVVDDGHGIPPADLALAFASHATSKLIEDEDLFRISTMGFRGEALASIGSVSHARLLSRTDEAESVGYEIFNRGGEISVAQAAAGNVGTTIEVRNLFFNVPARRKFLKGSATEFGYISETVLRTALAFPQVSFKLLHNGRAVLNLPATTEEDRLLAGWPGDFREHRLGVDARDAEISLRGIIGLPDLTRPTMKYQHLFLNGRPIRDKSMQHALREAYRGLTEPGRFPAAVLLLTIPSGDVDVNVHPTKSEVRFRDSGRIHGLVHSSVRETLLKSNLAPRATPGLPESDDPVRLDMQARLAAFFKGSLAGAAEGNGNGEVTETLLTPPAPAPPPFRTWGAQGATTTPTDPPSATPPPPPPTPAQTNAPSPPRDFTRSVTPPSAAMQLHNSYLVAQSDDGLVIIDQHALHERIMFEELLSRVTAGPLESQRLLIPRTLPATSRMIATLEQIGPLLARLGIEAVPFGPDAVAVQAFPSFLDKLEPADFVSDLLERGEQELLDLTEEELLHEVLDMMSCKAAVKAGDPLSAAEIGALLARRELVERSSNCPHGRPTTLRLSLRDLEKQFKRTGF